jgi:release factor glutamine methyltransferase
MYISLVAFPVLIPSRTLANALLRKGAVLLNDAPPPPYHYVPAPADVLTLVALPKSAGAAADAAASGHAFSAHKALTATQNCPVLSSCASFSIALVLKPAGVGQELQHVYPTVLLPLDKAATGIVVVCTDAAVRTQCFKRSIQVTYTAVCATEAALNPESLGGEVKIISSVYSNTDGYIYFLTYSPGCYSTIPAAPSLKHVIKHLASLGLLVLGHAKRRCSAGKGMFIALTTVAVGTTLTATIEAPPKFLALMERESKFQKPRKLHVGIVQFENISLEITGDVMAPCKSSVVLTKYGVEVLRKRGACKVLDAGTGSGCLLLSLLTSLPLATGVGVDISADALGVAEKNAARLELGEERCVFKQGSFDSLDALGEKFDLCIANPPYHKEWRFDVGPSSDSRENDPGIAIFGGGEDGLDAYRELLGDGGAGAVLREDGGVIILEVPHAEAVALIREIVMVEKHGWEYVETLHEQESGILRGVVLRKRKIS